MRRARVPLGLVLLFLLIPCRGSGEARVTGALDRSTVAVGESAVLTVTIEGAGGLDKEIVLDPPEGLRVREAGQSRSYSLVNGRFSQSVEIRMLLIPLREGTFEIAPFEAQVSGRVHRVGPFQLLAREGPAAAPPGPEPGDRGEERDAPPVRVDLAAEPAEVYAGEQVTVTSSFWKRPDVVVTDARFVPPEGEGFWKEDLPPERRALRDLGGISYDVTEIKSAFFPTRSGELSIGPAQVEVRYREARRQRRDPFLLFGGRASGPEREAAPASRAAPVRVLPLPEPAPPGFTGAVGDFRIRSILDAAEAVQGEPIPWTIEITGVGNIAAVQPPPMPEIPGCRLFEAGTEVETTRERDRIGGTKRISRVLIPESAGPLTIPAVVWSCFDPREGRYVDREIGEATIRVGAAALDPEGRGARIGGAIRPIRREGSLAPADRHRPWRSGRFWAAQGIPLFALGAALAWKRRREEIDRDPAGDRFRTAPRRFRRALSEVPRQPDPWGAFGRAVEQTLADRYGSALVGLPRPAVRDHLLRSGCDPAAVERVLGWLERSERARYAPGGGEPAEELSRALGEAATVVERLGGGRRA